MWSPIFDVLLPFYNIKLWSYLLDVRVLIILIALELFLAANLVKDRSFLTKKEPKKNHDIFHPCEENEYAKTNFYLGKEVNLRVWAVNLVWNWFGYNILKFCLGLDWCKYLPELIMRRMFWVFSESCPNSWLHLLIGMWNSNEGKCIIPSCEINDRSCVNQLVYSREKGRAMFNQWSEQFYRFGINQVWNPGTFCNINSECECSPAMYWASSSSRISELRALYPIWWWKTCMIGTIYQCNSSLNC